jgi:hypothetical protein
MQIYSEIQKIKNAIKPNWLITSYEPLKARLSEPGGEFAPQMVVAYHILKNVALEEIKQSDISLEMLLELEKQYKEEYQRNGYFRTRCGLVSNKLKLDEKGF